MTIFKIIFLLLLLPISSLASPLDMGCERSYNDESLENFSKKYLNSEFSKLPLYLKEWTKNMIDSNSDNTISAQELSSFSCKMSLVLTKIIPEKSNTYISQGGLLKSLEYWANDQEISSYHEFRIALGDIALQWLMEFIQKLPEKKSKEKILIAIKTGSYLVSDEFIDQQWDLSGTDQSPTSVRLKALDLAYAISNIKKLVSQKNFHRSVQTLLNQMILLRNFPYVSSVNEEEESFTLISHINKYDLGGIGITGVNRYYALSGLGLNLKVSPNGDVQRTWGQPKDQFWFLLQDPKTMNVDSKSFINKVSKSLDQLCHSSAIQNFQEISSHDLATSKDLVQWLQKNSDILADLFWQSPVKIIVSTTPLKGGSNAYTDKEAHEISFSYPYINSVMNTLKNSFDTQNSLKQIHRNLVFILIQEWIHILQGQEKAYDGNSFYNNPSDAFLIYGQKGVSWYENQPIEKDAKKLSQIFVNQLYDCSP